MMKVLFSAQNFLNDIGGAGRCAMEFVRKLSETHKVVVL